MLGVHDRDDATGQFAEISGAADAFQCRVVLEIGLQRDRIGDLATLDQRMDRLEDAAMDGVVEVLRLQELADLLISLVVGQDGPQQLLLRLRIVRGDTVAGAAAGRVRGAGSARI